MIGLYREDRSFSHFKEAIRSYDEEPLPSRDFLLSDDYAGSHLLEEFYIPFDYVNTDAKLMVIGLTPGLTQWVNAVKAAHDALLEGCTDEEILRRAKLTGAFSGKLRTNLIEMMQKIGLHRLLGVDHCETLFSTDSHLVHWTSTFINPILNNGKNYNGTNPACSLKIELLRSSFEEGILKEVEACSKAYLLPLGKPANDIFRKLTESGRINAKRVFFDMPHPSGASAERVACWNDTKTSGFSVKTNPNAIYEARQTMIEQIQSLL